MSMLAKLMIIVVLNFMFELAFGASTAQPVNSTAPVTKTVSARISDKKVEVQVNGASVDIGSQSVARPDHVDNSCTYSRFPCVTVSSIRISVDGRDLFVPRSVFADLSDITKIELAASGKLILLTLKGGDASEAFAVKILFSKDQVVKRLFYSALQDSPTQETIYFKAQELN